MHLLSFLANGEPRFGAAVAGGVVDLTQPLGPKYRDLRTLIAKDDQVIPAAAQRFMAQRAGARTVQVAASRVAMISEPEATTDES